MKIIKLQIQVPSHRGGTKILKQAVSLDKNLLRSIDQFIAYVKQVCKLNDNYALQIDGFKISGQDTVKMLQEGKIYNLKVCIKKNRDLAVKEQLSSSNQSDDSENSSEKNNEEDQEEDSQSSQLVPVKRNTKVALVDKKSQIARKIVRKKEDSPSQQSDSQEEKTPKKVVTEKFQKNKIQIVPQAVMGLKKGQTRKSSSSSQQSSEELPRAPQNKYNSKPPQKNILVKESTIIDKPLTKAVIKDSSQSEQSSSPEKQIKQKQALPQKNQTISAIKTQHKKLPPALRIQTKPQQKKFQQHCENQWIQVDKQKFKKWQDLGHQTFSQPPNKIRFKIIQFDEEKFIPVKSNWIKGEVSSIEENRTIWLINVERQGSKQFKKQYKLPEHNMDELQVWKPLATKEQLSLLLGSDNNEKEGEVVKESNIISSEVKEVEVSKESSNSIQKYICGQMNYYFSDRNYSTDFFMQLHANTHPQKYFKLSLMLNFPKIKKVLKDEDKLLTYLKEDQKYEGRNYEVDFENRMIRKKHIQDPREMYQRQESENQREREKIVEDEKIKQKDGQQGEFSEKI